MLIKLTRNAIKLVIRIFIKYIVAVAVPAICRKSESPFPTDIGKIKPEAKYIDAVATVTKTILLLKK